MGGQSDEDSTNYEPHGPLLPIESGWPLLPSLNAVLVDRSTGKLASRWCAEEDRYLEYYLPGTEPTELCDRSGRRFRGLRKP